MKDSSDIAARMKADWNRRVSHDYRFWMSDGYHSDADMWAVGARDFGILTEGLVLTKDSVLLDIGCGVGRLLRSACAAAGTVCGFDVSEKAIERARELLGAESPGLKLTVGNGNDLQPLGAAEFDVVVSFATLGSIPSEVTANYLLEINRVLKRGGVIRLQMYVGAEQPVGREDTLHLRAYQEGNLRNALMEAGFADIEFAELKLPLQVSYEELGFRAVIVRGTKHTDTRASAQAIRQILLPAAEKSGEPTADLEYWMTLKYAEELADGGDYQRAKETLDYAANVAQATVIDVRDLLERITSKIERGQQRHSSSVMSGSHWAANLELLHARFPEVARQLEAAPSPAECELRQTEEGASLFVKGQCLDHPAKPVAAAQTWAKRLVQEDKFRKCREAVVMGAGLGYHLEALLSEAAASGVKLSVVEPSEATFKAACETRDQRVWLSKVERLVVGSEQLPSFSDGCELWLRPQSMALLPDYVDRLKKHFYGTRGLSLLHPMIGVVGPLQGGTLPMVEYVSRALGLLNQRMRVYDVSGFDSGYHNLERFVKEPLRRKSLENTYCEMVSQVVLESVTEKPIDILFCMALAPVSPRVLTELRKRGVITVLWFVEDYGRFTYWKETAQYYDFIFTIQRGKCIEAMRKAGAGEVHYMPTACDPFVHQQVQLNAEEKARYGSPISFMGAGYHNRQQIFASLSDLPLKIWGTEWPGCRPFDRLVQEGGRRLAPSEYVKIFNAADININLHSSSERDGVDPFGDFLNPRTFELAASGSFQLVDKRSLLSECFEDGSEVATFQTAAELKSKIQYYLEHPEERRAMSEKARDRALREHTYQQRVRDMLSIVYSSKFEQLKARLEQGPWHKIMRRAEPHAELHERCRKAFERGEEPSLDALVSDIVTGQGKLSDTEGKLLFLFHVCKQIIRMKQEELGMNK